MSLPDVTAGDLHRAMDRVCVDFEDHFRCPGEWSRVGSVDRLPRSFPAAVMVKSKCLSSSRSPVQVDRPTGSQARRA